MSGNDVSQREGGLRAALSVPVAALLAALGLAGCTHSGSDAEKRSPANARSGEAVIERKASVDAAWIAGDRVYGLRGRRHTLAAPVSTTLIGTLAPAALTDPAVRILAYNSWRGRGPVIRLRDLATRKETLLDTGALSLAWRRDGALAYFKALQADARDLRRYVGHVVVRDLAVGGPPVRWTSEPGRYVVAAWAGRRLLVYRLRTGWPDLLVLDAPGRVRVLARAGALVAVSPDGQRAFVATYGSSPPVVRVLDVAGGRTVASSTLGRGIRWLTEAGSWSGEHVVATASAGLAVFRVHPGGITLAQVVRFPRGAFPTGVLEPSLAADGERVVARGELESPPREALPRAVVLDCDRLRLRCAQGPPVSSALGPHLVYNPSRP